LAGARLGHEEDPKWLPFVLIAATVGLLVLASLQEPPPAGPARIAYSEFKVRVAAGKVTQVVLRGDEAEGLLAPVSGVAEEGAPAQRVVTVIPAFGDPDLRLRRPRSAAPAGSP
jgi:hypothetical protein